MVRRFLDKLLLGFEDSIRVPPGRAQTALDFLEATDEIPASHRFAEDYRFDREELYEDHGADRRASQE